MKNNDTYVIAIDLGGTNLQCAVMDRNCNIVKQTTRPALADSETEKIIANIENAITETMAQSGLDISDIYGIGIGAPGIVDTESGIIHRAVNFLCFKDVPMAKQLGEKFGITVILGHDIDMAALAEQHYGAGRGKEHIVCITIGTGIGMGMILNGKMYRGSNNGAGNLGHMILDKDLPPLQAKDNVLEKTAAAPAIRTKAIESIRSGRMTKLMDMCGGNPENIDTCMVFRAACEGDELSIMLVEKTAKVLGICIANVINLLSPEVVIIGGGVALAGEILFKTVNKYLRDYVYSFPNIEINIVPSPLGNNAILIGAAHTVWYT